MNFPMTEMFESEIVFSFNASDGREGRYGLSGVAIRDVAIGRKKGSSGGF